MIHSIFNPEAETTLNVDETECENTCISIFSEDIGQEIFHYLKPKDLHNLISTLLHIQAKKRKTFDTKY